MAGSGGKGGRGNKDAGMAARLLKARCVVLSGGIDKDEAGRILRELLVLDARSQDPIRVFINSPGGDVDAGMAIFDCLRMVRSPVSTIATGLAASAGALVLLAAPAARRLCLPHARFLIHQPSSGMAGVASDVIIHADEMQRLKRDLNEIIAHETGRLLEDVVKDTERDKWMNASEALAYGLVGRIAATWDEIAG